MAQSILAIAYYIAKVRILQIRTYSRYIFSVNWESLKQE